MHVALIADFETIVRDGNRDTRGPLMDPSLVVCQDGFEMSVIAGSGTYSTRGDGGYTTVEVGFPTAPPEPWPLWREYAEDRFDPTETVYAYVPVDQVRDLIQRHGGER